MSRPAFKSHVLRHVPRLAVFACAIGLLSAASSTPARAETDVASSPASLPSANYWNQNVFFIPYRFTGRGGDENAPSKVELYVSTDGGRQWQNVQTADANLTGFVYNAPHDGEFVFALKTIDGNGQSWPRGPHVPQLRVVVDTIRPQLEVSGSVSLGGMLTIELNAHDPNLANDSLEVEVQTSPSGQWQRVDLETPVTSGNDFLIGNASWQVPLGLTPLRIRGSVTDRADNQNETVAEVSIANQQPANEPSISVVPGGEAAPALLPPDALFDVATRRGPDSHAWELADEGTPWTASKASSPLRSAPPPRVATDVDSRPARLPVTTAKTTRLPAIEKTPAAPVRLTAPTTTRPSERSPTPPPATQMVIQEGDLPVRLVNSRNFILEYDLEHVGRWGVAKVELWGTRDGGKSWRSYGIDPDNASPFEVLVDQDGIYGFLIQVDGAGGPSLPAPDSGAVPDIRVNVDLTPPSAEIISAQQVTGTLPHRLVIRWDAADRNLQPRPIGLYYSSSPNGPWTTIAAGLENVREYSWRIERHVPGQFFLRLEARDTAGNVTSVQTPQPIRLERSQPTGRIRAVRTPQQPSS